jgi:hypothetical protein
MFTILCILISAVIGAVYRRFPSGVALGPPEKFLQSLSTICALEVISEPLPQSHPMEHGASTLSLKPPTPSDALEAPRLLPRSSWPSERYIDVGPSVRAGHALYYGLYDSLSAFAHAALRCGPPAVFKPFSCFVVRDCVAGAALRSLLEVALVFGNTLNKVEGL